MRKRQRKFVGAIIMIVFVLFYAMLAMALSQGRITEANTALKTIWYIVLGLAWVIPLLPLIKWMEKPDPGEVPPDVLPR